MPPSCKEDPFPVTRPAQDNAHPHGRGRRQWVLREGTGPSGLGSTGRPGATLSPHHHPKGGARVWTNWLDTAGKGLCPHTPISSPHMTGLSSLARWGDQTTGMQAGWVRCPLTPVVLWKSHSQHRDWAPAHPGCSSPYGQRTGPPRCGS